VSDYTVALYWVSIWGSVVLYWYAGCQYVECWSFNGMLGVSLRSVVLYLYAGCKFAECGTLFVCWVLVCGVLCFHNYVEFQKAECYNINHEKCCYAECRHAECRDA
jgi:hypothetical protein